jgi:hypothetical protein
VSPSGHGGSACEVPKTCRGGGRRRRHARYPSLAASASMSAWSATMTTVAITLVCGAARAMTRKNRQKHRQNDRQFAVRQRLAHLRQG